LKFYPRIFANASPFYNLFNGHKLILAEILTSKQRVFQLNEVAAEEMAKIFEIYYHKVISLVIKT